MHMKIGMKSSTISSTYPEAHYFWPLMCRVCCSLSGAWHSDKHGLCSGPPSLWSVSHPFAAVRGLEESMGHQSDQYRGVSPPQARTLSQGFRAQWHQCKNAKLLCLLKDKVNMMMWEKYGKRLFGKHEPASLGLACRKTRALPMHQRMHFSVEKKNKTDFWDCTAVWMIVC